MPTKSTTLLYETNRQTNARKLEKEINELLRTSDKDVAAILGKYGARFHPDRGDVEAAAKEVSKEKITVEYKGAGFGVETVALAISLAPLIHTLTPLLLPWSKSFAKVSEKIALDVWDMLKKKLWDKKHIRLDEPKQGAKAAAKKSVKAKKNT
jgi:hypothetical protein